MTFGRNIQKTVAADSLKLGIFCRNLERIALISSAN